MGLFSGISRALFGDPTKDIRKASKGQLALQERGLDYMIDANAPLLEMRNEILPQLQGFYSGDANTQNNFINSVKSNPLYDAMINTAQEGIVGKNQALGMSRGGGTGIEIGNMKTGILNNLLNQKLSGLGSLASTPINTSGVANQFNQMGATTGAAGMGIANANQQMAGQGAGILTGLLSLSDKRLKKNIKPKGVENGFNTYTWEWNDLANDEFGLNGGGFGVIADEVELDNPNAIKDFNGYKAVDYNMIGVKHG